MKPLCILATNIVYIIWYEMLEELIYGRGCKICMAFFIAWKVLATLRPNSSCVLIKKHQSCKFLSMMLLLHPNLISCPPIIHFVIFNDTRSLKISVWNYQRKRSIEENVTEESICLARRYAWPPWNHDGGYYLGFSRNSLRPPYEHLEENSAPALDGPHAFLILLSSSCPHRAVYLIPILRLPNAKDPNTVLYVDNDSYSLFLYC